MQASKEIIRSGENSEWSPKVWRKLTGQLFKQSNLDHGLRQSVGLQICLKVVYFKQINSFLVFDTSLLVTIGSRQCLDMIQIVSKIENGLEGSFVKHRLNCLL